MEENVKKAYMFIYVYMYDWIPLLYTWNYAKL